MQTLTSKVLRRHCQNQTSFLRISPLPLKVFHSFPDNLTEIILYIFCLLFLLYCNLYKVEGLTRFGIGRNYNNYHVQAFQQQLPIASLHHCHQNQSQDFLSQSFLTASMFCSIVRLQDHTPQRDCKHLLSYFSIVTKIKKKVMVHRICLGLKILMNQFNDINYSVGSRK